MADPKDNAPYSVNRPPYPNMTVMINRRVETYLATILVTAGVPSVVQTLSSRGIAVTDAGVGRIGVTFPAGPAGTIGWVMCSLGSLAAPTTAGAGVLAVLDSDLTNFETGTLEVTTKDYAGADADVTTLTTFTLMIHTIRAQVN